jgi:Fe-S-cluster-containing dehydrogenase component
MTMDRRTLLKGVAAAGAGAAVSAATTAEASSVRPTAPPDAVGMLYDATRCIGCQACVTACKTANDLPGNLYDPPKDLDGQTKNIIKLYEGDDERSYMKQQCMQCIDPGCVNACMIGAFKKREFGIITWDIDRCIGCRYCQVACPYNIPKFQWDTAVPKIVKCELCLHIIMDPETGGLREGALPGCVQACPKEAVIFGKYEDLLADARQRVADHPERYFPAGAPQIFGDTEGGGTQVLYLAGVDFEKLGLPELGDDGVGVQARAIQHGIYGGFIAPVALYGILGAVLWRNRRAAKKEGSDE